MPEEKKKKPQTLEQILAEKKKEETKEEKQESQQISPKNKEELSRLRKEEWEKTFVEEFEKRDEELVKKEIMGDIITNYFYEFKQGNKTIRNLSLAGIREIARKMGHIESQKPEIEEFKTKFRVATRVKDLKKNLTFYGVSEQSKIMKFKEGGQQEDSYALQKCVSKSLRNALVNLIPQDLKAKMLKAFIKEKEQHQEDAKSFIDGQRR